jgi:hypothetical protein
MPMTAGVGQSTEPSQSLHCPTHLTDGFAKLVVQPQVFGPEAPSEYLRTRATRLKCERIESDEIVLGNSKRNHSRFLVSFDVR